MMEAMERKGRPVVKEECPVVESMTAPATPHNVLDRRSSLCCQRRAPGRCDQCCGVLRQQECVHGLRVALFVFCNRALATKAQLENSTNQRAG